MLIFCRWRFVTMAPAAPPHDRYTRAEERPAAAIIPEGPYFY